MSSKEITALLSLIVYDFDGVMTDNRVLVDEDGNESVLCNRSDGLGVGYIKKLGIPQLILSTETNPVVAVRAKKLNLPVIHGCGDKKSAIIEYCVKNNYSLEKVLYVGNDTNDLDAMKLVGFPVAPADANQCIQDIAVMVTKARGGEGVVREIAEKMDFILESKS